MDNQKYFEKIDSASSSLFDLALGHETNNDRYTDMEEIGSGAIKKIQRVLDLTSGRPVALATPKEGLSKEQIQYFLEEARLTASLEHPNIIQVYDLGFNQEGSPYFTMKLCSSKKLTDILKQKDTSLFQLLDIYLKICDAVDYAHNSGAIHRDLKPENILLGNFGEVLVCDWGSAQIIPGSNLENEVGQLSHPLTKGTPGFMAPEQESCIKPNISQDIFALGAILYNMLTREKPHPESPKKPSDISTDIASGLEAICLKAMAKDSTNRYENTEELIQDVKAWMSGFAPSAEDASFQKQLRLLILRHKTLTSSILSSIIIISCLSLYYVNSLKDKEMQTRVQRDRAERALALYDLEKENRRKIAELGANYFIKQADQLVTAMKRDMGKELLDSIPNDNLSPEQIRNMNAVYGRFFVYKQRFNEAYKHLSNASGYDSEFLFEIAKDYSKIKADDDAMLSTADTVEILDRLNNYEIHQAHCFYRDQVLRIPDYFEQVKLIEKMILVNNEWMNEVNISLKSEHDKYHLDLSNNPNMSRWVPVRQMPLSSIDLSNNPKLRHEFSVLENMPLEKLNVSGSPVDNFSFVKKLPKLKVLIIDSEQAKLKQINKLGSQIKIVVE